MDEQPAKDRCGQRVGFPVGGRCCCAIMQLPCRRRQREVQQRSCDGVLPFCCPEGGACVYSGTLSVFAIQYFPGRIPCFDSAAARAYADMRAGRRAIRRPVAYADCLVAVIAGLRGIVTANRNVNDFRDCGVTVIAPVNRMKELTDNAHLKTGYTDFAG